MEHITQKNKDHDGSNLIYFLPKNSSTTSPTSKNLVFAKSRTQIEAKKIVGSISGNNIISYLHVALSRGKIPDDRLKEHMEITNKKLEDNNFVNIFNKYSMGSVLSWWILKQEVPIISKSEKILDMNLLQYNYHKAYLILNQNARSVFLKIKRVNAMKK